jgi:hypothetical protein
MAALQPRRADLTALIRARRRLRQTQAATPVDASMAMISAVERKNGFPNISVIYFGSFTAGGALKAKKTGPWQKKT